MQEQQTYFFLCVSFMEKPNFLKNEIKILTASKEKPHWFQQSLR